MKPWLKRRKNLEFYETLLAELWLEYEYNYNILLRMTSENFEKIFQMNYFSWTILVTLILFRFYDISL